MERATLDPAAARADVAVATGGGPALMDAVDADETLLALENERGEN